ncbi:polyketide synthase [Actinokineospora sp. NBRC 105648]|uniref:beta-ketoacyl [acyl carrier protein] synthase domain-containing protein n=1 Tax=Actinokineospora sp. NBRC 105648 TaxID=3032206 RepID=UPI0024A5D735|nr:polyketide synthase [Actinokineospora sp. NBRC 105648]GLZ42517.1 hypothetical protein Acsp05_61410 [Actinokineospora sp. NBRC 105648]
MASAVAVVGVGCALPGARTPDDLWRLLVRAGTAVGPARPGTALARAGLLAGLDAFDDLDRFDIDRAESARMDPQQRVLLTVVDEAVADAGLDRSRLAGSRTAVYTGQSNSDHWDARAARGDLALGDFPGSHQRALLAGRVSHVFDLRGPGVTVDAAQASSLVAIHLACRALRAGDADLAIAGGVNLLLGPHAGTMLTAGGVLSPRGRCAFGDAEADGFVRAEGAAAVVLKPLAAARAAGDRIRAVIAGSAVSNDGRAKESLLHPSEHGQAEAMRWAYADAGIDPAEVDYVEAHGTGTRIDLAELGALNQVLAPGRPPGRPCLVGSVKTNIGHAEAAAGVAGLVKAILCLEHDAVPASLHLRQPHPAVDWDRVPLVVPTGLTPLPRRDRPGVVAVNGQSISSTNVHVVLTRA